MGYYKNLAIEMVQEESERHPFGETDLDRAVDIAETVTAIVNVKDFTSYTLGLAGRLVGSIYTVYYGQKVMAEARFKENAYKTFIWMAQEVSMPSWVHSTHTHEVIARGVVGRAMLSDHYPQTGRISRW